MAWDKRGDTSFTWRGGEVSRLEGFSDAVFGFALTLLVVSMEVPRTFDQLVHAMKGFFGFAFCFVMLLGVWEKHYRFFRRFGLQDGWTLILNGLVLFVVVFYVYPLKFLSTLMFAGLLDEPGDATMRTEDNPLLFAIYGCGFATIIVLYAVLYLYAYRRRSELSMSPLEVALTRNEILRNVLMAGLGLASVGLAELLPPRLAALSGFAYFCVGLIETWHGAAAGRLRRRHAAT
jgi:uncharacterized membrane protein